MKKIRAERVSLALTNLADWKRSVQAQCSTHLFPLLALLSSGVGTSAGAVQFNETPDEYEFWDRYFRLSSTDDAKPYFNPITLRHAEKGFPHSNSATIRKNTFAGKWHGAVHSRVNNQDQWRLTDDYADIFRRKVLSKSSVVTRVPVLDVAVLLFRGETFDDGATTQDLEGKFRSTFPQHDADYEKIFVFRDERQDHVFIEGISEQDYEGAISSVLIPDVRKGRALGEAASLSVQMDLHDPILTEVQRLLQFGTSGIILTGSPGTGKSHYAKRIAKHLVDNPDKDVFRVQFHPSYGYEDFVEGYRPDDRTKSGYKVVDKIFLVACRRAEEVRDTDGLVVVIVDEINRDDPARIFGELLTYIEQDYRDETFTLPFSGRLHKLPKNLVLIGTMNPFDRSIAPTDAAFVRRFDHIPLEPSREVAELLLEEESSFRPDQIEQIGEWFDSAQRILPFGLGHSYFARIGGIDDLLLVWRYRIKPAVAVALELDDNAESENLAKSFDALVRRLEGSVTDE